MAQFNYRITGVDFDMAVVHVELELKDGGWQELAVEIRSIATSDADSAGQLEAAIQDAASNFYKLVYPDPIPRPEALLELVGNAYVGEV